MVLYLELVLGDLKKNLELNVHAVPIHMLSFTYCTNAQAVQMQPLYNSHSVLRHTLYCCTWDQYTRYTNPHGEMTHTCTIARYTNTQTVPMYVHAVAMCILYHNTQCTRAHGALKHTVQTYNLYQSIHCIKVYWCTHSMYTMYWCTCCFDEHTLLMHTD